MKHQPTDDTFGSRLMSFYNFFLETNYWESIFSDIISYVTKNQNNPSVGLGDEHLFIFSLSLFFLSPTTNFPQKNTASSLALNALL